MKKKLRGLFRIIFGRTAFVMAGLGLQLWVFIAAFKFLNGYLHYFYILCVLLSALAVIAILNEPIDSSFKMAWIIPVLVIPVFGVLLYIFVQMQFQTKALARRLAASTAKTRPYLNQNEDVRKELEALDGRTAGLADYLERMAGAPVYKNTDIEYFPLGEDMFVRLMKELKAAKHFIFMEFFIIDRGYMWDEILKVLEEKVKEGVEVRVMYDGMCCLMLLPFHYPRQLERKGIRCKMFSPIIPVLSTHQNYRDHRKIAVIDGRYAFTGGVNLADEYINRKVRFGHWKDTALMVRGDAVKSFTMMFLQMWDVTEKKEEDYRKYLSAPAGEAAAGRMEKGYVIPYGDSPFDKEQIGEQVYLDILSQAKEYVHIMTPYLILDDGMKDALCYAAKRGVEVIIIMPHIPDKKYAYLLARTYYPELLKAGVRIFEYEPGFVHAKVFASDDEKATVGTINLDFRSLYLHFECGTFLYRNPVIEKIEADYQETLKKCIPVTLETCYSYSWLGRKAGRLLRLIAPLMYALFVYQKIHSQNTKSSQTDGTLVTVNH